MPIFYFLTETENEAIFEKEAQCPDVRRKVIKGGVWFLSFSSNFHFL